MLSGYNTREVRTGRKPVFLAWRCVVCGVRNSVFTNASSLPCMRCHANPTTIK